MKNYNENIQEAGDMEDMEGLQIDGMLDYIKPNVTIKPLTAEVEARYEKCGISAATAKAYGIGCNEAGDVVLPFYEKPGDMTEPVRVKLVRSGAEKKSETVPGGKEVLFGSHLFASDSVRVPVLTFAEGDALSATEAGFCGLATPNGYGSDRFLKKQTAFVDGLKKLVIAPQFSIKPEIAQVERCQLIQMVKKLGAGRISIVREADMDGCKNLNELLVKKGREAVQKAVKNAGQVNDSTVYSISKVKYSAGDLDGYLTGWTKLDSFTGGFGGGKLTIIGGNTEQGKTTTILNIIGSLMAHVPVFYWSGEEPEKDVLIGLNRIMGGPLALKRFDTMSGKTYHLLDEKYDKTIREYYDTRFFVFDDTQLDKPGAEVYFRKAEYAIQRFGCKIVIFDNLMAFTGGTGDSYLQAQADFAEACKRFGKRHNVHVFLVAHNRKFSSFELTKTNRTIEPPAIDDIEGSSKITNWADFVIQVWRVPLKAKLASQELADTDTVLNLCKNRGYYAKNIGRFKYCQVSRRIYELQDPAGQYRKFGWEPAELAKRIDEHVASMPTAEPEFAYDVTVSSVHDEDDDAMSAFA